jgi:hypothetical protein
MTALVQTVLKNTHTEAVVKITGTGTATIALASLALADETYTAAQANVTIRKAYVSAPPTQATKVTRNSVDVLQLFGTTTVYDEGYVVGDQASKDITVTTAGDGTVILSLRKTGGFDFPYRAEVLTNGA